MKSYLKFLSRNKLYTAIEAVGLVISIAFVILIGSYVTQNLAVVYEQPAYDRIYSVGHYPSLGLSMWDKASLEGQLPEIEAISRFGFASNELTYHDQLYEADVRHADADFFDIFPQFSIVEGTANAFEGTHNAIVSKSFANRLGKTTELLGQQFVIEEEEYTISGIMEDPQNTLISHFDVLIPVDEKRWAGRNPFSLVDGVLTFIRRKENTEEEAFKAKVLDICQRNYSWIEKNEIKVYDYKEMFFHTDYFCTVLHRGNLTSIQILTVVVLLLLLSAVINYVNLNMALVGKRAREMATRRLLGAQKLSVMGKLVAESVLFTAVCFGFAFLLAHALVPTMNRLLVSDTPEADIQLRLLMTPAYMVAYVIGILLLGVLSGWLPALFASRYAPIEVVRGAFRQYNKMWFNKIFIVFQSVLSFVLIALAIVMEVQMWHMVNRPTHLQTKDLFVIGAPYPPRAYLPIVEELRSLPCVEEVGIGQGYPGKINYSFGIPDMEDDSKSEIQMVTVLCDSTYFQMLGFEVVEDFGHPKANSLWLGEHVLVESGVSDTSTSFLNRIAAYFSTYYHLNVEYIGGVVCDFPVNGAACADGDYNLNGGVFVFDIEKMGYGVGLLVKTTGDHAEAERQIMDHYNRWMEKKEVVGIDVKCGYVDDLMLEQLEPAKRTVRLLEIFMGLSVLLSLLGLVAMSTYYCDEGSHSIAIRKVFGSDVNRELWRTVKDYMILVGIAAIIGAPVAVWLCGKYLERFAYRIEHYGWIIVVAVVVTMLLAFLSVLWQTLRAAKTNPAEALKKE